jgi:hypothetical protein
MAAEPHSCFVYWTITPLPPPPSLAPPIPRPLVWKACRQTLLIKTYVDVVKNESSFVQLSFVNSLNVCLRNRPDLRNISYMSATLIITLT